MSVNQSRSDKNDAHYRKSGPRSSSSAQQRTFSGGAGKGGGNAPPSSAFVPSSSLPSNRSFKRTNNVQGGQSRVSAGPGNSESANLSSQQRSVQNGAHTQPSSHGPSDASAGKPTELAPQKIGRAPKAPSSKVPSSYTAAVSSDTAPRTAPDQAPDESRLQFSLQFGSINPGFVNGMQIPARTSSAPPNLDEQKRDQARHDTFVAGPTLPLPPNTKQQQRKGVVASEQSNALEAHHLPKVKRDVQVSSASPPNQTQKPSVLPMTGIPMQLPYHQPQVSVQFSGPTPQIQSQGMTATSLQMPMPMPLPMGNASQVQQQVFVPGLQPHPLQPQGMIHQGQGLGFTTPMGPQMSAQLGNLPLGITQQYTQQQPGKFGVPRKAVKITHPETHEELRLDKRADPYLDGGSSGPSGPRSHPNLPPPSQPITSFTAPHAINFYPNSYNASSLFFPSPSSLPLTSTPLTSSSQAPRFNYPVSQGPPNVSFLNPPSHNSLSVSKTGTAMPGVSEQSNLEHARDVHNLVPSMPSATSQVTIKPPVVVEKVTDAQPPLSSAATEKFESPILSRLPGETSSFHLPRNTEINSETSSQPPKTDLESSTSALLPGASNQFPVASAVSVENSASNTLSSAPSSLSDENTSIMTNNDGRRRETLSRSNSTKEHQKKMGKKGHLQPQHQAGGQTASMSNLPSRTIERGISSKTGITDSETSESKAVHGQQGNSEDVLDFTTEPASAINADSVDASELKADNVGEGSAYEMPKTPDAGVINHAKDTHNEKQADSLKNELSKQSTMATEGQGENELPERFKHDAHLIEKSSESILTKSLEAVNQHVPDSNLKVTTSSVQAESMETAQEVDVSSSCSTEIDGSGTGENLGAPMPTTTTSESINVETVPSNAVLPTTSHGEKNLFVDASLSRTDSIGVIEVNVTKPASADQESVPVTTPYLSESTGKPEGPGVENVGGGLVSHPVSSYKDKPSVELNRSKSMPKKKKRKEILQKADAAGTTSDLYMAYKGPEEKKETTISSESMSSGNAKQLSADAGREDVLGSDKDEQPKGEPDDWEDAADISTPKLETQDNGVANGGSMLDDNDGNGVLGKKYSRDFLLTFADQCNSLPEGFIITSDIAEAVMISNINTAHLIDRDSYPSPGRIVDRQVGGSRSDRRGSGVVDDDKWSKLPGSFTSGRDLRPDIGYGVNVVGFRPGQGGNYGVLRNPRGQSPMPYVGGILSGPMQSMGSQGGQRNSPDADRWQRATGFQKGLIPSPQTPVHMHKAEKKYEVGKVSDEEEVKQRKLKAILNKLTPQNFEKLFEQVKEVNIDNAVTLTGVISQIFDKALMEPTFCEMYANFCFHLAGELPDLSEDNEKITFKRMLLNKCQEEFERGVREQEEANRADEEGEIKQSEEQREEKRMKARRRMLGNIRLIGELYKKKMLTERIMHECITTLLGQDQNPDEEDVESLCKLMSTIGEMIDHSRAKVHMDGYFDKMKKLSNNMKLSPRVRFMLKDSIDLRKNKWQQRRKVEGPKKIEEVHRDAAQERQAQVSRLSRGPSMNSSARRGAPPMDFGPRGSTMLSSPNSQMGGFRGLPSPQVRGYGGQDVRLDDRQSYESRTLSVPLPHRPIGDDSITLGPQGGLAKGMSIRAPPIMSSGALGDITPGSGDSRRMTAGLNGYSSVPDRTTYSSREEIMPRYIPDRFGGSSAYDQSSIQERNLQYGNRDVRTPDRSFDRSLATSPPARSHGPAVAQNVPLEKVWPEERLRDMSIAAIREFYSAKDENEVALCIKDLNSTNYYPSMVSIWVTDSFERKDMERDMLAKLLVNLAKSRDGILSQVQLMKGFELVLTALEDAVNDAPKAAEFLGRIFAKVIVENVMPLGEVGQLIHDGGEEPGQLREIGLAAEVLGSTLETIKSEKGESVLNEIRRVSNLRLDDFRPSDPSYSSAKLDEFI